EGSVIDAPMLALQPPPAPGGQAAEVAPAGAPAAEADLSLEAYFRQFVLDNQEQMTETELARRLGISRKALWERRQRFDLPRLRK
ncbi:MAG TPA: sigma-54-dependent Fis family transcriptional regulator, partial [Gammaproteobacteria bacterium]